MDLESSSWQFDRLFTAVEELTRPRRTAESVAYWDAARHRKFKIYTVDHQPLLVELAKAVIPRGGQREGENSGKPSFGSREPVRLDAIDTLARIRTEVEAWCFRLDLRSRRAVADDMRSLVGAGRTVSDETCGQMGRAARGWASAAKVITGEESPAYAPHVPCPQCEAIGGLRIRLEQRLAACLRCGADWGADDGGIYILAEHVRLSAEIAG